jgi:ribose/xylose/arabinose/galactoside ABC-type transport system permease subunit
LALAAVTWFILARTVLGRHLYALGGNEQAARLSGIRTDKLKWFAYVFGAMTASLAGLFYIANEGVSAPVNQGRGHELNAIAAAVVGGCSLQGGIGTVPGTMLGALFLRIVIDSVAKIIESNADIWEGLIVGVVVVLAVTFSQLKQWRQMDRKLFSGMIGWWAIVGLSLLAFLVAVSTGTSLNASRAIGVIGFCLLAAYRNWESRPRPST